MRIILAILAMMTTVCFAQAPVETGRPSGEQLQRDQYKAGAAYRDMQNAERAARDAEFEHRQADTAHKDLQKRTEEARLRVEAAKKKVEETKATEAQARKAYDAALGSVDRDVHPSTKK